MSVDTQTVAENALIALLAVNSWSIARVFGLRDGLRDAGLFHFENLASLDVEEVARRLTDAGYARGDYMNALIAVRVVSMAQVLSTNELVRLTQDVEAGNRAAVASALSRVKGVGPVVLHNFWVLQEP